MITPVSSIKQILTCSLELVASLFFAEPDIPFCFADIIAQSKSGTGKTLSFAIPALEALNETYLGPQVLILSPTRELAAQTHSVISELGKLKRGLHCRLLIGGLSYDADVASISPGNVLIGTPGRISQLIRDGYLQTQSLRMFVLDEADKMLQDGSMKETTLDIMSHLPETTQRICVSATYTPEMLSSLDSHIKSPEKLLLAADNPTLAGVKQYYACSATEESASFAKLFSWKVSQLIRILQGMSFHQCIVFSNLSTKSSFLSEKLNANGWPTKVMSAALNQSERLKTLEEFRDFKLRILVCSDLVARGLDIERINLVINLDIPYDAETYLHRVGRTGRFGTLGVAINLLGPSELSKLKEYAQTYDSNILELPDVIPTYLYDYKLIEEEQAAKEALDIKGADFVKKLASGDGKKIAKSNSSGEASREKENPKKRSRNETLSEVEIPGYKSRNETLYPSENRKSPKFARKDDNTEEEAENAGNFETDPYAPQPPPHPSSFRSEAAYIAYIQYEYLPYVSSLLYST